MVAGRFLVECTRDSGAAPRFFILSAYVMCMFHVYIRLNQAQLRVRDGGGHEVGGGGGGPLRPRAGGRGHERRVALRPPAAFDAHECTRETFLKSRVKLALVCRTELARTAASRGRRRASPPRRAPAARRRSAGTRSR